MTIRRIVAYLSGSPTGAVTLTAACSVARRLGAHLDGIFLKPDPRDVIPMLAEGVSGVWLDDFISAAESDVKRRQAVARSDFEAAAARAGIAMIEGEPETPSVKSSTASAPTASARWVEMTGRADLFAERARLYDLLVFGPGARNPETQSYAVLEAALMGAGRPLLLAPQAEVPDLGNHIAIGWNGGIQAARAVAAALPFIEAAQNCHVITVASPATETGLADELSDYLAWHGTRPSVHKPALKGDSVGATLLEEATGLKADLLVLGGFGHSRLRELILGGVTRHVLTHATMPVLIAH